MLGISDLKRGTLLTMDNDPWEVLESNHVLLGRGSGHLETKIRNLRNGNVLSKKFRQADKFEEADVSLSKAKFVYANRGKVVFSDPDKSSERFEVDETLIEEKLRFVKEGSIVDMIRFGGEEILGIKLPPKVDLKVTEAEPWAKGDTASGGTKSVTVETGATFQAPPFINEGDVIRINTERGDYVERVEKA